VQRAAAGQRPAQQFADQRQPEALVLTKGQDGAMRTLPMAIRLVAKSSRIGSWPGSGMPTQKGLVTKRASRPPNGATTGSLMTLT
jgi:hypothetical protein